MTGQVVAGRAAGPIDEVIARLIHAPTRLNSPTRKWRPVDVRAYVEHELPPIFLDTDLSDRRQLW
jgi:hypothetical protein